MEIKTVHQGNLTSECWTIQMWGLKSCETCKYKNSKNCGGKNIRKTGKNRNGLRVPIS